MGKQSRLRSARAERRRRWVRSSVTLWTYTRELKRMSKGLPPYGKTRAQRRISRSAREQMPVIMAMQLAGAMEGMREFYGTKTRLGS